MKRISLTLLALFVMASITMPVALAESVHNKKGPSCADNGLFATCTGLLAGLGNFDILVKLTTTGFGDTTCTNQGGNTAPGQNPGTPIPNISGIQVLPASSIKNGNAGYTVQTQVPADPTWDKAGCSNSNWSATWSNITFAGISASGTSTLTVFQCEGGTYSQQGVCSADPVNSPDGIRKLTTTIP